MAWELVAIAIATLILSFLLRPKLPEQTMQPGEVEHPVVEEGKPYPIIFGTRMVRDPNIGWFGDVKTKAVKSKGGKK